MPDGCAIAHTTHGTALGARYGGGSRLALYSGAEAVPTPPALSEVLQKAAKRALGGGALSKLKIETIVSACLGCMPGHSCKPACKLAVCASFQTARCSSHPSHTCARRARTTQIATHRRRC